MERYSITDLLVYLAIIVMFATLGAGSRLLSNWDSRTYTAARVIGSIGTAVFAAMIAGLLLLDLLPNHPNAAFAISGLAAWGGQELLDKLTRRLHRIVLEITRNGS